MKLPNKNKRSILNAFTLIELLVVVAVLGMLTTFVVIRFTGVQSGARDAKRQSELKQYQTALEVYANRNNSVFPVGNNVEADSLCGTLGLGSGCPDDPTTTEHYRYYGSASTYVLWARMEKPNASGNIDYFILCSNGKVGMRTAQPSSATCPLP